MHLVKKNPEKALKEYPFGIWQEFQAKCSCENIGDVQKMQNTDGNLIYTKDVVGMRKEFSNCMINMNKTV